MTPPLRPRPMTFPPEQDPRPPRAPLSREARELVKIRNRLTIIAWLLAVLVFPVLLVLLGLGAVA